MPSKASNGNITSLYVSGNGQHGSQYLADPDSEGPALVLLNYLSSNEVHKEDNSNYKFCGTQFRHYWLCIVCLFHIIVLWKIEILCMDFGRA